MFDDILKRVEAVDWAALENIYPESSTIPIQFINLLSQDIEIRDNAIEELMGSEQDYGIVSDTTPYVVSFLVEFLKANYAHPEIILASLSAVSSFQVEDDLNISTIREMRNRIRVYDIASTEIMRYNDFLKAENEYIRACSASLLGCFSDKAEIIADWLHTQFIDEKDPTVQIAIIWAIRKLICGVPDIDLRNRLAAKYRAFYREIVETNSNLTLKTKAAQAFIVLCFYPDERNLIPQVIITTIIEGVVSEKDKNLPFFGWGNIRYLARLSAEQWLPLMNIQDFSPENIHLITKAVLISFQADYGDKFQQDLWDTACRKDKGIFYQRFRKARFFFQNAERLQILKRIADYDAFWELPTNLLSQFGGLPDSHEELRKFISANSQP